MAYRYDALPYETLPLGHLTPDRLDAYLKSGRALTRTDFAPVNQLLARLFIVRTLAGTPAHIRGTDLEVSKSRGRAYSQRDIIPVWIASASEHRYCTLEVQSPRSSLSRPSNEEVA